MTVPLTAGQQGPHARRQHQVKSEPPVQVTVTNDDATEQLW